MFFDLFDSNEKQIKKLRAIVSTINDLESKMIPLSDIEIREKTVMWKNELRDLSVEESNKYLDKILNNPKILERNLVDIEKAATLKRGGFFV